MINFLSQEREKSSSTPLSSPSAASGNTSRSAHPHNHDYHKQNHSSSSNTSNNSHNSTHIAAAPQRIPPPIIIPADQNGCEKSETILEGEVISCFIVGGEKRLCLPQILTTVLGGFTLPQINSICDELRIYCSRCSPEQLEVLKVSGILPASAPSCGLITKTDAERLCAALLFYANNTKMPTLSSSSSSSASSSSTSHSHHHLTNHPFGLGSALNSKDDNEVFLKTDKCGPGIPVAHQCFGQCAGILYSQLYIEQSSRCIRCNECLMMFSPQRFVCHTHGFTENRTCHWGFDSFNWRHYIHLNQDSKEYRLALACDTASTSSPSSSSSSSSINVKLNANGLPQHGEHVKALERELEQVKSRYETPVPGYPIYTNKRKLLDSATAPTAAHKHHEVKSDRYSDKVFSYILLVYHC